MNTSCYNPHPALVDFVENITILTIDFTDTKFISPIYTFVPTHTRFLCFYLEDKVKVKKQDTGFGERERSIIIGPQTTPVTLDLGEKHTNIIVCLRPSGMYRLLGIPLHKIVDHDYDARLIIGAEINEIIDRLTEARTDELKSQIIQQYLLKKLHTLKPAHPFDRAMLHLVSHSGNLSISQIASQCCMSIRQFERKSLERLGVPPKFYARLIRFSHAYKMKETTPHLSWLDIAHQCGYYDQMHFIKDFKYFAGFVPSGLKEDDVLKSVRFRRLEDVFLLPASISG